MSIPKTIHYSWLSKEPIPENLKNNIKGWEKILHDYEFVCWDSRKLEEIGNPRFAYEAYLNQKWAFAADYLRMYAVYNYGGIWLDLDVELFQSFDLFLENMVFIGRENWVHNESTKFLTAHAYGSIPGHPFIKKCLDYYQERPFVLSDDVNLSIFKKFDMKISPEIMADLAQELGYDKFNLDEDGYQLLNEGVAVYPSYYFCHPRENPLNKTICVHHCTAAWAVE